MTDPIPRLEVYQGDITRLKVDAIVNAANTRLLGGGGVDGAIHRAAGPELLEACRKIGGCPTGEARITAGYGLPADWVIHTVGPIYRGVPADRQMLTACYRNSLELAAQKNVGTVAFPAISCGVYGYPIEKAARIAIETTLSFLNNHPFPGQVIFALFSEKDTEIYRGFLTNLPT
ncbi:MAG: O-acetyl-ADP-ribose deacetylase [Olavius algarvensis Delta 4 endosymbiont]|nr:MAG: O-acetyl-ADP-ribose deacetylase [Olavius algarvensis Delta 4 endosymbiont]